MAKKPENSDSQRPDKDDIQPTENYYGSLLPEDMASIDPTEIVDYTGTIGAVPEEYGSGFADASFDVVDNVDGNGNGNGDDVAQTRMVEDDFYKQVQSFFPTADSGSGSAPASTPSVEDDHISGPAHPDAAPSLSVRGVKNDFSHSDFVPPVRDIRFPSDTATLEALKAKDPDAIISDEYGVVAKLGEGGYGVVFEADQRALNRPVAVKVLKPKRKQIGSKSGGRTGTGSGELQRRRDQFLHEAKITAKLQHPNIVPLYDFGINKDGQLFYSMKKVEKRPWSSILHNTAKLLEIAEDQLDAKSERNAINKNVEIFDRVCDAMAYTHAQQVIHRDLKPDNIMIGDYGEVLLIDFGMALDLAERPSEFSAGGTLVYMAPEMARHFAKQKEIQVAAQKTAKRLGVEQGSVFLDKSNLMGIGKLAQELIQQSKDDGVIELAETLIRLDGEEKQLASKIGIASDIYLLGAILYQIAVGHPPHYFPIAYCKQGKKEKFQKELWLALRNGFQQYNKITDPLRLSLRNIAVKAMKTDPSERYQSVEELQDAIRNFQLQVQSLELVETGREEMQKAAGGTGYQHLLPAMESFRGAAELWPEGKEASQMQVKAACEYAKRADRQRDYDAGLSILDEYVADDYQNESAVVEVRQKLHAGKRRRARNRTLAAVGWMAAIAIPIGVYLYYAPLILEQQQEITDSMTRIAALNEEATDAREAATNAKAEADKEVELAREQAQEDIRLAKEQSAIDIQKAKDDAQLEIEREQELAKQEIKKAKTDAEKEVASARLEAEKTVAQANLEAEKKIAVATDKVKEIEQEAAKLAFDANFGVYNETVLTVPLALRTGKLNEAAEKLAEFSASDAKPYFKNGWAVSHFAKRSAAGSKVLDAGEGTKVADLLPLENGEQLVLVADGQRRALKLLTGDQAQALELGLPEYGRPVAASLTGDTQWVAIAIDDVSGQEDQPAIVLFNLNDGSQVSVKSDRGVLGCRTLAFSPDGSQLLSVEELAGSRGLSKRIQVVRRSFEDGQLGDARVTPVSATTRDEGRPDYLAKVQWDGDVPVVALAYQSLSESGADVFRLEAMVGKGDLLDGSQAAVAELPTALLMLGSDYLLAGFADGLIRRYQADDMPTAPMSLDNENGNRIVALASNDDGQLVSGSENGTLILWNRDLQFVKRLNHQPGELTSLAVAAGDATRGMLLVSGDAEGNVSRWYPETGLHDAIIRHESSVTVTSGAVDASADAGPVPATAYGTQKGDVYYFDQDAMLDRNQPDPITGEASLSNATFRFRSPFESFGTTFNDFDSMGIVQDYFVLLKDDGTFYSSMIDESRSTPSAKIRTQNLAQNGNAFGAFYPLMASVHDKNYFFSTDPNDDVGLLAWNKVGDRFEHRPIDLPSTSDGRIKRLTMSQNGQWLALVRSVGKANRAGFYVVEIYDIADFASEPMAEAKLAGTTLEYPVGDPAFVAFSPDSRRLILHYHQRGVDRVTLVERWALNGSQWALDGERQRIDERKVALVDWDPTGQLDKLVTKINRKYFLADEKTDQEPDQAYTRVSFSLEPAERKARLKSVRYAGQDDLYYVLSSDGLNLFQGTDLVQEASFNPQLANARDLRVFGDRAILLDQSGFHLVDIRTVDSKQELNYVTKVADRVTETRQVALSSGRLAILYSNQRCRIWNVSGTEPSGIGEVDDATAVELSSDGRWAAIRFADKVGIYSIESRFENPKFELALAEGTFAWTGGASPKLLLARSEGDNTVWEQVDPATGNSVPRQDLPRDLKVDRFQVAPLTGKYLAVESGGEFSLWATGKEPVKLDSEDSVDFSTVGQIRAFSFSEIEQTKIDDIGTRLAVLSSENGNDWEPRLFLLASDEIQVVTDEPAEGAQGDQNADAQAENKPEEAEMRHRVVEIEGALSRRQGVETLSLEFSGDGRSLIQVDENGISTLLGK